MSFDGQRQKLSAIAFDKARILLQILGIGAVAAIADRVVIYHH